MRAFITGDRGFVGEYLKALLAGEGMSVAGFDSRDDRDVRDYEHLRQVLGLVKPDYIFHLAARAVPPESLTNPRRSVDVNVHGTLNLLEAVRHTFHAENQPRILIAGTSEEYGYETQDEDVMTEDSPCRPTQPYGVTKLAASQLGLVYVMRYGLRVVVTRAYNHAGPGVPDRYVVGAFARKIIEVERGQRDVLTHGNLSAVRNVGDVRDVVRAYRLAVDQPSGSIFIVCSDHTTTVENLLKTMIEHARVPVRTSVDPELYREESAVFPRPSHDRLTEATGWRPEYDLDRTLADTLEYYRRRREL